MGQKLSKIAAPKHYTVKQSQDKYVEQRSRGEPPSPIGFTTMVNRAIRDEQETERIVVKNEKYGVDPIVDDNTKAVLDWAEVKVKEFYKDLEEHDVEQHPEVQDCWRRYYNARQKRQRTEAEAVYKHYKGAYGFQ